MNILALCGSIRAKSSNLALLKAAQLLALPPLNVTIYPELSDLPYYNPDLDLDLDSPPAVVKRLREKIQSSNAILISTPEYAHGVPGVLKNALDWLVSDPHFAGKPVGLLYGSATEASFAHSSLIEILNTMSARLIPEAILSIPGARTKINSAGAITDPDISLKIAAALKALINGAMP